MYKRINRFTSKSLSFQPQIQNVINSLVDRCLLEFEYALFKNYDTIRSRLGSKKSQKISDSYAKVVFQDMTTEWVITFSHQQTVELLDALLTEKMEKLMVDEKSIYELKENPDKQKCEKIEVSFANYIQNRTNKILELYQDKFQNEHHHNRLDTSYTNRPLYFLLYRIRNNILREINERSYSIKALESLLSKLRNEFEILLYKQVITNNLTKISNDDLQNVFATIEKEVIDEYLMQYRLGHTEEEGNQSAQEVREKLELGCVQEKVKEKTIAMYMGLFSNYDETKIKEWFRTYIQIFNECVIQTDASLEKQVPLYATRWFMEHLRIRLVGTILPLSEEPDFFSLTYQTMNSTIKQTLAESICNDFFTQAQYTVYFGIDDLKSPEEVKKIEFGDIAILSDQAFQHKQAEWYEDSQQSLIVRGENAKAVWAAVDVVASFDDVEMAVTLGLKRIERFLSMLYHFISREDEINYSIRSQCVIYNHTRQTGTLKHLYSHPWKKPKDIISIHEELVQFLEKQLASKRRWSEVIGEAITLYIKLLRCEDIQMKFALIKEILDILFHADASFMSSVIIAGNNIDKDSATYGNLRHWLYEDYQELMDLAADKNKYLALKERILERFQVFTKMILRTIWFALDESKEEQDDITDVIDWIVSMHPDAEVVNGGTENE